MEHELKTWSIYYSDIESGAKTFEIRKDDRGFKVGDTLLLRETHEGNYTGRELRAEITYKLIGGMFGCKSGYCILGIRLLLSSEAEKGEKKGSIKQAFKELRAISGEYWDNVKCPCSEMGRSKCELNCPEYEEDSPSPPSPQEKQGVEECKHEWEFIGSVGDERCRFCGAWSNIDGTGSRYMIDRPAPAAPDKGEARTEVEKMIDEGLKSGKYEADTAFTAKGEPVRIIKVHPTPSVEKSEGEEAELDKADLWLAKQTVGTNDFTLVDTKNNFYIRSDKVTEYLVQYAHSSGDRGRKEWPSDKAIAVKLSELAGQIPGGETLNALIISAMVKYDNWLRNEVRQMNQGQKSKS